MSEFDEPILAGPPPKLDTKAERNAAAQQQIRALMDDQPYAVLCTQGGAQPYGSIIAFAVNEHLNVAVFATPIATRKFRLLTDCDHVALVVDNRSDTADDVSHIHALTATGTASILVGSDDEVYWRKLLLDKHPQMREFVCAPGTAIIRINILHYIHVARLQEVYRWTPSPPSR